MASYRRGYNWELVEYLSAPIGGWNPDLPPHLVPNTQAPILDNFIIHGDKMTIRGPIVDALDLSSTAPLVGGVSLAPIGYVCGDAPPGDGVWALIARKSVSGGLNNRVDPWNAPIIKPTSSTYLASGDTHLQWTQYISSGNFVTALTAPSLDQIPGPRSIAFDGVIYGLSYDCVAAAVNAVGNSYVVKPTNLLTLPQTQSAATAPTVLSNAPHGALDLKAHQSRIWLLGGIDTPGAGTTFSPTTLFFTVPIAGGGGTASADWKDPVSGLTNQIVMDRNLADPGVGLGRFRANLIVFRRSSIWILRGTTTSNYTLSLVSSSIGCIDARSIVEGDRGIHFLSEQGLMLTDGVTVRNVSGSATRTLQRAIAFQQQATTSSQLATGGWAVCLPFFDNKLLVSLGTYGNSFFPNTPDGTLWPIWCGLFDTTTGVWVRITSQVWAADCSLFAPSNAYPGIPIAFPNGSRIAVLGSKHVHLLDTGTYTIVDANLTFGITPGNLYDVLSNGQLTGIHAQWTTRLLSLGNPRHTAQAKRWFMDHVLVGSAHAPIPAPTWTVTPVDARGVVQAGVSPVSVAATDANGTVDSVAGFSTNYAAPLSVAHNSFDLTNEVVDLAFKVEWNDPGPYTGAVSGAQFGEVYGLGVEFQPARDRP